MVAPTDTTVDFLGIDTDAFTESMANALVRFRVSDTAKARMAELAEKANYGTISADEQAEYLRLINLAELLSLCQAQARGFLGRQG